MKQDVQVLRRQHENCAARESLLHQNNRQLQSMVASHEAEKADLLARISSVGKESDATTYWKIRLEIVG